MWKGLFSKVMWTEYRLLYLRGEGFFYLESTEFAFIFGAIVAVVAVAVRGTPDTRDM